MAELTAGEVIGGFEIKRLHALGGMGELYEAVQLSLGRPAAIKVIAHGLSADREWRERFRREARLAAAIEHPNVLPVYDIGETPTGRLFLAMRWVDGKDLETYLDKDNSGRLEPGETMALLAPIASALDEAHRRGIVHRDLKPKNVMLDRDGLHPFLTDFGLARRIAGGTPLTSTGQWFGTPDYISPEQIKAEVSDAKTDVYAFGCMVYRCVTGDVPYPAPTLEGKFAAHLYAPIPLPSAKVARIGTGLDEMVRRALQKSPEDRPATVSEAVALSREGRFALAGQAIEREDENAQQPRRALRRLVTGRTTHAFDEETTYELIVGETDEDDAARFIRRTRAKPDPGPGVFWRTAKFRSIHPAAQRALVDRRVVVTAGYVDEPPWDEPLDWAQTNDERKGVDRYELDVVVAFPRPIRPGEELAWQVTAHWPGFHRNVRDTGGNDRNRITLARPTARFDFVVYPPPSARGARFVDAPEAGSVVRADKELLHWRSNSPAPAGRYHWEHEIDLAK